MDLIIYLLILVITGVFAVLGFKYWWLLGAVGGVLGAVFTYLTFQATEIVTQIVYDQTAQVWVYQTVPMGFFAYVPLVLAALCFAAALRGK